MNSDGSRLIRLTRDPPSTLNQLGVPDAKRSSSAAPAAETPDLCEAGEPFDTYSVGHLL